MIDQNQNVDEITDKAPAETLIETEDKEEDIANKLKAIKRTKVSPKRRLPRGAE